MTNFTALAEKLKAKVLLVNMEGADSDFVTRVGHKLDVHPRIQFDHKSVAASSANPQALIDAIRSEAPEVVAICAANPEDSKLADFMGQLTKNNPNGTSFVLQFTTPGSTLEGSLRLDNGITIVSRHEHAGDSNPTRVKSAIAETIMQRKEPKRETGGGWMGYD